MSKITFRADDDLVRQLEEFDASKSEVMREALRSYLDEHGRSTVNTSEPNVNGSSDDPLTGELLDGIIAERVDEIIEDRSASTYTPREPQDVNVTITIDGDSSETVRTSDGNRKTRTGERENTAADAAEHTCKQCGEDLSASSVYCSNCGEKASHRVFCECGDELRSDWGFCPGCGRRTPAADVLWDT